MGLTFYILNNKLFFYLIYDVMCDVINGYVSSRIFSFAGGLT